MLSTIFVGNNQLVAFLRSPTHSIGGELEARVMRSLGGAAGALEAEPLPWSVRRSEGSEEGAVDTGNECFFGVLG